MQEKLEELEPLVIDARFECTGPYARLTTTEYAATLNKMLGLIRSIDEVNESCHHYYFERSTEHGI